MGFLLALALQFAFPFGLDARKANAVRNLFILLTIIGSLIAGCSSKKNDPSTNYQATFKCSPLDAGKHLNSISMTSHFYEISADHNPPFRSERGLLLYLDGNKDPFFFEVRGQNLQADPTDAELMAAWSELLTIAKSNVEVILNCALSTDFKKSDDDKDYRYMTHSDYFSPFSTDQQVPPKGKRSDVAGRVSFNQW